MNRELSKGVRYIQLLDQARCNGDWDAVPELVRKVRKHAPERTCLVLTAECEHTVTQASGDRKSTATGPNASSLGHLIAPLSEAIRKERSFVEDEFQARVCLGWIYWVREEHELASTSLPEKDFAQLEGIGGESAGWTKVCALKASYIKGTSLTRMRALVEALEAFESALPILSFTSTKSTEGSREQRTWAELLLTQFCMLESQAIKSKFSSSPESESLSSFRAWASFWEYNQNSSPQGGYATHSDVPRRQIWKEYYSVLSKFILQSLPFPNASMATAYGDPSCRRQQEAELRLVESKYENLLLREVQFPRADQTSDEVEEWAELVVQNWRILCGSNWQAGDQDQSRRETLGRRVLDILYRATTKTFHSTAILRHLFTVHLAVGEFDIAFKAFDTYLKIVKKGKARIEKSGEAEKSLDSDETVLKTVSECIRALCRYGSREAAGRAKDLAQYFEDWLCKHHPQVQALTENDVNVPGHHASIENGIAAQVDSLITPQVLATAWRSIGIAKAQWARVTYDAGARSDIQTRAIKSFRMALSPEYNSMDSVETLFALAMVLSERRELNAAIEVVKKALLPSSMSPTTIPPQLGPSSMRFAREKALIPLWHLLALLLSARQEFATAARACEGAFEQFQDPKNLFGDPELTGSYQSEHLNIREKPLTQSRGVVDEMDDFQKETVLEVKMTQLVLVEVLEGPEVAVNASDELLSLYTRLFGELQQPTSPTPKTAQSLPPQSSAGTLRSIKGSLFGRSRPSVRKSPVTRGRTSPVDEQSPLPIRPQTSQTHTAVRRAPTIHVTNESGGATSQLHHHDKLHKRRSTSLSRKKSHSSLRIRSTSEGPMRKENQTPSAAGVTESHVELTLDIAESSQIGRAISPGNSSAALPAGYDALQHPSSKIQPPASQNMLQREERLKFNPSAQEETRLTNKTSQSSSTNPYTQFSKSQERRRRTEILVRVWLLIAGFYRRADMFADAKGAIDEAYKLVEGQEMDVSRDNTGNITIHSSGWGCTKSVEELWGDVWSERGSLSIAKKLPYTALSDFEAALTHYADHPSAIVGLSNILLDIYTEILPPAPSLPSVGPTSPLNTPSQSTLDTSTPRQDTTSPFAATSANSSILPILQLGPLGLASPNQALPQPKPSNSETTDSTALLDRLAARDRAYGLLSGLTKLGSGWNYSEAWFALARAQEEAGLVDKARDTLWWCVELEEGRGVRNWNSVGAGGYVL